MNALMNWMKSRRRALLPFLLVLGLLSPTVLAKPAAMRPLRRYEFTEAHMGTAFRIVCYAKQRAFAERATQAAFKEVARLDAIMSDYNQASELNRLAHQGAHNRLRLSADLFRILTLSQQLAAESRGAFDVTVGAMTRLWRRARRTGEMPEVEHLAATRARTGYRQLRLDAATRSASLMQDGVLLDLGGIAKGYAADAAMRVLKRFGIASALIAAGGDIVVSQAPPGDAGWTIALATANDQTPESSLLLLENAAVSTSGDAEQFVEIGGKRYSHILDPRTGLGLVGRRSATVIARRGVDADSLATALCVLGEDGMSWLEGKTGVAAFLVVEATAGGDRHSGRFTTFASKRWRRHLKDRQAGKP